MPFKRTDPLLLNLSLKSRPGRLLEELNNRYREWVHGLSNPLSSLALQQGTFLGESSEGIIDGLSKLNPAITCLPWLFWEISSKLGDKDFCTLSEASAYHILASIVLDHALDNQVEDNSATFLFHKALYTNGIMKFREALPAHEMFWESFDRLSRDHIEGLGLELHSRNHPDLLTQESFQRITNGKVSPFITAIWAFVFALGQASIRDPLASSLRHVSEASCLLDDIWDWEMDLESGHLTYFLARLVPPNYQTELHLLAKEDLRELVDVEWVEIEHFQLVINCFDEAINDVEMIECPAWIEYIRGYRDLALDHSKVAMARRITSVIDT
jgi:hypothetical protein